MLIIYIAIQRNMVDALIVATVIATLLIIGLNVFLFRKKIYELLDFPDMISSKFSKSVLITFIGIILIYLFGFFSERFSNPIIFFFTIPGMIAAIYGMGLKKRWFMFFWLGIVASAFIIAFLQIDRFELPIWSLIIMGLMLMNLHYYNVEKNAFYV